MRHRSHWPTTLGYFVGKLLLIGCAAMWLYAVVLLIGDLT